MLAMCKTRPEAGGVEIRDIAEPQPLAGEVRIKVAATGICGTDVHIYKWAPDIARLMKLPVALGHEISGVVDGVGSGVHRVQVGDRVSVESHISCGHCYQCHLGKAHLCRQTGYPGITRDGGFAAYTVVPEHIVWVHATDIPLDIAALFEPFGIGVHASLEGCGVSGMNVLITGCGPIGLMSIAAARALGASCIIATDVNPTRLALATQMGADRVVDVREADPVTIARDMTRGNGVDVALEYSGDPQALTQAVEALTAGGDLRLVGAASAPVTIDITRWILKGIRIYNIHGRKLFHSWEHASRLVYGGKVDLRPVISHTLPLREGLRAFELIEQGVAAKVLVTP